MAGFIGQYENVIDEKGRVAVPAKMRQSLTPEANQTFTAVRGEERCITLYPLDVWQVKEAELRRLNRHGRENRAYLRAYLRWAEELTLDKQGRIVLPKRLMEFANLSDTAVIIGALDTIEIWDPVELDRDLEDIDDLPALSERVMG